MQQRTEGYPKNQTYQHAGALVPPSQSPNVAYDPPPVVDIKVHCDQGSCPDGQLQPALRGFGGPSERQYTGIFDENECSAANCPAVTAETQPLSSAQRLMQTCLPTLHQDGTDDNNRATWGGANGFRAALLLNGYNVHMCRRRLLRHCVHRQLWGQERLHHCNQHNGGMRHSSSVICNGITSVVEYFW